MAEEASNIPKGSQAPTPKKRAGKKPPMNDADFESKMPEVWHISLPKGAAKQIKTEWANSNPQSEFKAQDYLANLINNRNNQPTTNQAPSKIKKQPSTKSLPPPSGKAKLKKVNGCSHSVKAASKPPERDWLGTALWTVGILLFIYLIYRVAKFVWKNGLTDDNKDIKAGEATNLKPKGKPKKSNTKAVSTKVEVVASPPLTPPASVLKEVIPEVTTTAAPTAAKVVASPKPVAKTTPRLVFKTKNK